MTTTTSPAPVTTARLAVDDLLAEPLPALPSALDVHAELLAAAVRDLGRTGSGETLIAPFDDDRAEERAHLQRLLAGSGAALVAALASAAALVGALG